MRQLVGALDAAVDLGSTRPAEEAQRIESRQRGKREEADESDARRVRHKPEQAEP
jgi:hypothetical protein